MFNIDVIWHALGSIVLLHYVLSCCPFRLGRHVRF